jgi:hypothetical protein
MVFGIAQIPQQKPLEAPCRHFARRIDAFMHD